jgi:hypothetical protein
MAGSGYTVVPPAPCPGACRAAEISGAVKAGSANKRVLVRKDDVQRYVALRCDRLEIDLNRYGIQGLLPDYGRQA